jgi:hypothetical protein
MFFLIAFQKTNFALVVVMNAVNVWKARQGLCSQFLPMLVGCGAHCLNLGNFANGAQ